MVLEEHGTLQHFGPGETIFRRGEEGRHMYVVDSGQVEIIDDSGDRELRLSVLGPEEIFGEMALFGGHVRSATARAVDKASVRAISKDDIYEIVRDQLARHLLVVMGERLRDVDRRLAQLTEEAELSQEQVADLVTHRSRFG